MRENNSLFRHRPATAGSWKPGQSGNPKGRPVGSLNFAQKHIAEAWADFVAGNSDRLNDFLDALPPEKQGLFLLEVSKYIAPMVSRSQVDVTSAGRPVGMQIEIVDAEREPREADRDILEFPDDLEIKPIGE